MDERQLIVKIKRKPKDGLIDAFEMYGPLVKAITVKVLGNSNSEDVEECISDTFISCGSRSDRMMSKREA